MDKKKFMAFVTKEFLHILRDPKTLLILFGMPIVQIVIFGFALTNEVKNTKIAVLNESNSNASTQLINKIEASSNFEITTMLNSSKEIDQILKGNHVKMVLVIPKEFEKFYTSNIPLSVQLIADGSDPNTATALTGYASNIIVDFYTTELNPPNAFNIQPTIRMLYNPQLRGEYNFVPGVMALVLMLVCTLMTSIAIVREKELGTMEVLLTSPITPMLIIVAKTAPYLFVSVLNIISIIALSVFVLMMPIKGHLLLLFVLSVLFTVTCLALGLLISSSTASQQTAMLISLMGMFLPTIMLSGFMFPIENMPYLLQLISNVVPAKWYYQIVQAVMLKGLGLTAIIKEVSILIGMTLLFLLLSIRKFKIRIES